MPGFPLAALGAGIGIWAQNYQQQKAREQQQQMLAIQLARYKQEQDDRQKQQQLGSAEWQSMVSGTGGDVQPVPGTTSAVSGGFPGGGSMPVDTSGGDPLSLISKYESGGRNIKNPTSSASGPWQFLNSTWREMAPKEGVDINQYPTAMSAPVDVQKRVAQRLYNEQGYSPWAPYNPRLAAALRAPGVGGAVGRAGARAMQPEFAPNVGATPMSDAETQIPGAYNDPQTGLMVPDMPGYDPARATQGGGGGAGGTSSAPQGGGNAPRGPQMAQASGETMTDAGPQMAPPSVHWKSSLDAVVRQVAQMPGLSGDQRAKMVQDKMKQIAPREAEYTREYFDNLRDTRLEARTQARFKETEKNLDKRQAEQNWEMLKDPTNNDLPYYVRKGHPETAVDMSGQPYKPGGAAKMSAGGAGQKSSANIHIVGADGQEIFKGSAHQAPGAKEGESSWIDDRTQKRIEVPADASLTILGKGGEGRQAAAQMVRLTSAANEARRQIQNVARAAKGSTTSWFQGVQAGPAGSLGEGVRQALANVITPRDEQIMSVLGRGIGRSLASLETAGAATGLMKLSDSMQQNMPAKNDDVATALLKIAEMRQIAEQGIESAMAAPTVGEEQRKLLRAVRDDIQKAVPYTVGDVQEMIQDPDADTYQSFAAKIGLGQKGGGVAGADGGGAGAEVIQNGWRYDSKTHQPLGPAGGFVPTPGAAASAPIPPVQPAMQ